jgi:hypothetical protein
MYIGWRLIHPSAWKVNSLRFISTILYNASLLDRGFRLSLRPDSSRRGYFRITGERDGRSHGWRMVKYEA